MGKGALDHLYAVPVAIPVALGFRLVSYLDSPAFSPLVTGPLLYALTRSPERFRTALVSTLRKYLSNASLSRAITALTLLFGVGVARRALAYLNVLGQNNFRLRSAASDYDWPNEIAVVTGAAGGIGSVIAADLAAKGIKVLAVDLAAETPSTLRVHNQKYVHYYQCDLTDRAAVMDLAKRIQDEHGHPSILINNAGIAYQHTTLQASEEALRRIFNVNLISYYYTLQAFLPAMIERKKGHIVHMASIASFSAAPSIGPYSATKAGVVALHESLSQELRLVHNAPQVLTTIVHPTFVRTAMTAEATERLEKSVGLITPQEVSDAVTKNVFAGRGGQVVIAGALGRIPGLMRTMPHAISYALLRAGELHGDTELTPVEKKMG